MDKALLDKYKLTQTELDLYTILHHPLLFPEFITPVDDIASDIMPMEDWYTNHHFGHTRLYQYAIVPWDHTLPSNVPIDKSKPPYGEIDRKTLGEAYVFGGRKTSKSWTFEHDVIQYALIRKGESCMVTSLDDVHLTQRLDGIWRWVRNHPLVSKLVNHEKRGVPAKITWYNGHVTDGVYESMAGQGNNYLSFHDHRVCIEEFQLTSKVAFDKLHDAVSEKGVVLRTIGVSDGRIDTPAHEIRQSDDLRPYVHAQPQYVSQFWTPESKKNAIRVYGGVDSHNYKTNVDAEEGDPSSGVWNIEDYLACIARVPEDAKKPIEQRRKIRCPSITYGGKQFTDANLADQVSEVEFPPRRDTGVRVIVTMDVGYKPHPTVFVIWGFGKDMIPRQWGKIVLLEVPYKHQARFLLRVVRYYGATTACIDITGTDGRSVVQELTEMAQEPDYPAFTLCSWDSRSNIEEEFASDQVSDNNKMEVKKTAYKEFFTVKARVRQAERRIEYLDDATQELEFRTEITKKSSGRFTSTSLIYIGPKGDHLIDNARQLEYILYLDSNTKSNFIEYAIINDMGLVPMGRI